MIYHHEAIILQKGFEPLESLSLRQQIPQGAIFRTLAGLIEITFYAPTIIRLKRLGEDTQPDYGILVSTPQPVDVDVTEIQGGYCLRAGEVALEVLNGPMRIRLLRGSKLLLNRSQTGRLRAGCAYRRLQNARIPGWYLWRLAAMNPCLESGKNGLPSTGAARRYNPGTKILTGLIPNCLTRTPLLHGVQPVGACLCIPLPKSPMVWDIRSGRTVPMFFWWRILRLICF